jgi:hypothetical protein
LTKQWRAAVHWRKVRLVRDAARRLPGYDISWAVIAPSDDQPDGWDYHLIRTDWGIQAAYRLQRQTGGWILHLR